MKRTGSRAAAVAIALACLGGVARGAAGGYSEAEKLFALKVKPLLAQKCFACHGEDPEKIKGGLNLLTREGLLAGGETFGREVLIPGDAAGSILLATVKRTEEDYEMPPKEDEALSGDETRWIAEWIDGGAPWPDAKAVAEIYDRFAEGVTVATSGGLSDEWTNRKYHPADLWAYQPIVNPAAPVRGGRKGKGETTGEAASNENPIDAFVDAKLADAGLAPAPRADRATLIRRATFDLTGLPPAPEEIEEFVNDPAPDKVAFAEVIDRLLADPRYGEQWGRHWLDVVRYADSAGFANDFPRPNAWRYRDYVIRAFNEDKPYDEFVREQLAGDEIDAADPELLVATGFLRMGPWEHTGMSVAKVTRQQFLDDITDTVGQAFLGHALQCARCHDHKFDPVPTQDYYRMQAVFATTQFGDRPADFLPQENRAGFAELTEVMQGRVRDNQEKLAGFRNQVEDATRKWCEEKGIPYKARAQLIKEGVEAEKIPPRDLGLSFADLGRRKAAQKAEARSSLESDAAKPIAFSVYNGKTRVIDSNKGLMMMPANPMAQGELEETCILTGGDPFAKGAPVSPGTLSAVAGRKATGGGTGDKAPGGEAADAWYSLPEAVEGRRLALADWIISPENTLTARVMVNRIWQYHFGKGIAANANNFGATGKKPTHPELLDWLAHRFVEEGWSVKAMHRHIMNSRAYARAAEHPQAGDVEEKDPGGILYARFQPRRLAAEEIRDAMLACSGELNPAMGGIPARPEMNLEAALQPRHVMGGFAPAYQPDSTPAQRNRRTVYALKIRGLRDPFMEVFNQPSPERSCELREASTVSPQVFSLFNGQQSYDRAVAMARRLERETDSTADAVARAFALVYGRAPSGVEREECVAHVEAMRERHRRVEFAPQPYPAEIVREGFEEMTGEPFTFGERLDAYMNYVADAKLADVGPETRALADLCLVLFNSNEFVYVY